MTRQEPQLEPRAARRTTTLAALAAGLVFMTACAPEGEAEFAEASGPAGESEPASAEPAEETAAESGETHEPEPTAEETDPAAEDDSADSADAAAMPLDPQDAIETISYEVPGDSNTTVEVGLHSLRVEGEVMLLELTFTGEFYGQDTSNIYQMFGGHAVYPELNDRENLKQYTVIGSGSSRWSTPATNSGFHYESGQTAPYWAYYAAPVDDIETITVSVIPGAIEFEDVEIDWDGQDSAETAEDTGENDESDGE
ncbi:hypothetical protein M3B43_00820 [Nesterenkonia massiliensis]|uniref:Uncharacterized protein n=1 Tax=Nesterenkonia massiliensis TaxID=1232429 RepID=A0ABT2HMG7_9MICC|nr:hypothetical protein [Nesterenkonia massiliensis]MCT1605881.1 hypothetical protein [Nesterenkonia massiliensis]